MGASVKVMLSYNFCHFEISKHTDQDLSDKEINELRKDVQRLADESVRQYIIAKTKASERTCRRSEKLELEEEVKKIKNLPASEWSATQKAKVKALEDHDYWIEHDYDYEDDDDSPGF